MTGAAWELVRRADRVVSSDPDDAAVAAVRAAGIDVGIGVAEPPEAEPQVAELVWLVPRGDDDSVPELVQRLSVSGAAVEVVSASYDLPGARLLDLVEVMDRLRTGCPWDRRQTHQSLTRYLIEEAYETLEAIESGDRDHLREELGDLLLQVVFHARLAAEDPDAPWDIDDVAAGIVAKLVHRHPHVFAGLDVVSAAQLESNWESLKHQEKQRDSVLAGVPPALPALARADKLLRRAARAGLSDVDVQPGSGAAGALGDSLFRLVRGAVRDDVDPEQALRDAIVRFTAVVRTAEPAAPPPHPPGSPDA